MTALSNPVPWAVLDLLVLLVLVGLGIRVVRVARTSPRKLHAALAIPIEIAAVAAIVYLAFLGSWGLNYRREPLRTKIAFDAARVHEDALSDLAFHAVRRLNDLHGPAHAAAWPDPEEVTRTLAPALDASLRSLPGGGAALPGVPKRSLLSWYFERAAIDGMTNPFGLEVIVQPQLLPFERHAVIAHEWAHLAGYASEDEANFVGWLICLQGDAQARYSAWLAVYLHVSGGLPRDAAGALSRALAPGVREDLRAIRARARRASPAIRAAAWRTYDGYLKANRVASGVRSYNEAVTLALGTGMIR
jgi:hypothetical protein